MESSYTTENEENVVTFEYDKERDKFDTLIASWKEEVDKAANRRIIRENKRNVAEERQKGTLLQDETIIPDRTINTNIRQGRGNYINYITQSIRMLIVTQVGRPNNAVDTLETWYTDGARYQGWKLPWVRSIDCMHVHGGVAMEVMFDESKPLHFNVDYIPRESLIVPIKTRSIQACPRILRCYELTTLQLEEFAAKYGFDSNIVKKVLDCHQKKDSFIKTYRALLKKDGIVYNGWYVKEGEDWLRAPQVHDIGLFDFDPNILVQPLPDGTPLFLSPMWNEIKATMAAPLPLKQYPIVWFPYEITENEHILETSGRVALDLHTQEAKTETMSATVNGCTRASRLYASAEEEPGSDAQLRELGPIKHGHVMSHGVKVFNMPWPNNIILAVNQALGIANAQDAGRNDFAAMARPDANKTKYELEMGADQTQETSVTDMDIFSISALDVNALCFNIATHQAIFGLVPQPTDPSLLIGEYNLQCAGDVEVTKRLKDDQNAKELFNIVQGTPLGEKILFFLIKRFFPDQADEWLGALMTPDKDAVIMKLVEVLEGMLEDIIPSNELTTDQISALRNVIATARAMVEQPGNGAPASPSPGGQAGSAPPSNEAPQAA
jgi:hypothetical protein